MRREEGQGIVIRSDLRRPAILIFSLAFALAVAVPAAGDYPKIRQLSRSDVLFAQLQDDVQQFHQARRSSGYRPPLFLFRYELSEADTFFRVSSRTTLPQSTLATVNRIHSAEFPDNLREVLIPNQPGIFVPLEPMTDLEYMLSARLAPSDIIDWSLPLDEDDPFVAPRDPDRSDGSDNVSVDYRIVTINTHDGPVRFAFFPGADFSTHERRAFLGVLFRTPVEFTRITSPFGARLHPFTGRPSYHTGVDLAAPEGTPVRAAREGTVVASGWDPVYGYYVIMEHDDVFTSFYGHMSVVHTELNANLTSGMILGEVGSTGLSTGPHLHFEIRVRGSARDPVQFLHGLR